VRGRIQAPDTKQVTDLEKAENVRGDCLTTAFKADISAVAMTPAD